LKFRLTREADRDISQILTETYRLFGRNQLLKYSEIIQRGISKIVENPNRASTQDRSELRAGVRSFHLQLAAGKSRGAAHILYYCVETDRTGTAELIIIRVLAEQMEPKRRVLSGLRMSD
jgi:toxin ParE1/3/4